MTFGSVTRHILCCTLLGATTLMGAACSGGKGPSGSGETNADLGIQVTHDNWHKIGYDLSWIGYPFGKLDRRQRVVQFQAYDDIVIAQSSDSTVTVLEATTGKRRWGSEISSPLTRYMGLAKDPSDANRINVCSESELFVLAISNGALLSRQQFERVVSTAPLMVGETIVFGTNNNELYAHGSRLGNRAWGMITDGGYTGAPILVGDTIATVAQSGAVQFLTSRGKLVADRRIYGGVETEPVTNGSKMIVASLDQSLWGFDPFSAAVWRYRATAPLRVQ
ncbi:MAG: PQQ-binding-like beta-propeller repeat protein, partial [Phycisphaerales bacterium]